MDRIDLLNNLFDQKKLSLIKIFLNDKDKEFYLRELAKVAKVSVASTFRIVNTLAALNIVEQLKIKKFKLYRLAKNENTVFLESFLKEGEHIVKMFVDMAKNIPGVEMLILHGKDEKDKANILVIGENVDAGRIKEICAEIMEKYKFKISSLTLTMEQFEQMRAMGLYPGEKKVLFRR